MSMIGEQVKELREVAKYWKYNAPRKPIPQIFNEAADTIESLSAKLAKENMERSAEDCNTDIFTEILENLDNRIGTHLKIMAGLNDETQRYGYAKALDAYQQIKTYIEITLEERKMNRPVADYGWILCSEKYPENEKEVEITFIRKHWKTGELLHCAARAFYEDGTLNTVDSSFYWEDTYNWEYDEEKDGYLIPEGWWESVLFSEEFGAVDMPVVAWREIMEPYHEP